MTPAQLARGRSLRTARTARASRPTRRSWPATSARRRGAARPLEPDREAAAGAGRADKGEHERREQEELHAGPTFSVALTPGRSRGRERARRTPRFQLDVRLESAGVVGRRRATVVQRAPSKRWTATLPPGKPVVASRTASTSSMPRKRRAARPHVREGAARRAAHEAVLGRDAAAWPGRHEPPGAGRDRANRLPAVVPGARCSSRTAAAARATPVELRRRAVRDRRRRAVEREDADVNQVERRPSAVRTSVPVIVESRRRADARDALDAPRVDQIVDVEQRPVHLETLRSCARVNANGPQSWYGEAVSYGSATETRYGTAARPPDVRRSPRCARPRSRRSTSSRPCRRRARPGPRSRHRRRRGGASAVTPRYTWLRVSG